MVKHERGKLIRNVSFVQEEEKSIVSDGSQRVLTRLSVKSWMSQNPLCCGEKYLRVLSKKLLSCHPSGA